MRWALPIAMLLAVVGTALVGVLEHAQLRALEYQVASLERRRIVAERRMQRLAAAALSVRTPRSLLLEREDAEAAAREAARLESGALWADDLGDDPGAWAESHLGGPR